MENSREKIEKGLEKTTAAAEEKQGNGGEKAALPYSALSLSKKNVFAWAAVLFALLSFASRIAYYSPIREGSEGAGSFLFSVFFIVLPGLCYLFFTLDIVFKGERELYRTSRPTRY